MDLDTASHHLSAGLTNMLGKEARWRSSWGLSCVEIVLALRFRTESVAISLVMYISALPKNSASFVYVIVMPSSSSLCKVATSEVAKESRGRCNVFVVLVVDLSNDRKSYRC